MEKNNIYLLFGKYIVVAYFILLSLIEKSLVPVILICLYMITKIILQIIKKQKYSNNKIALLADICMMWKIIANFFKNIFLKNIFKVIYTNKITTIVIVLYIAYLLMNIDWGIPNSNHPFNYFMDEWHQSQAVRSVFVNGTPNISGSANGSMFHFLLSGLMLAPFVIFGIINPFAIKSSLEAIEMQQKLFEVFRLNTLFFGIMSVVVLVYIVKKYFKLNGNLVSFLFVVNPAWIMLSNYFKYDIALVFWIILSLLFILRYSDDLSVKSYALAAFFCGLAISVKVSALPLLPVLIISYFIFAKDWKKCLKYSATAIVVFILTFLFLGIPDLILGKGDIGEYLYDNLVRTPNYASNYVLGMNYVKYLVVLGFSTIFGYFLFFASSMSIIFLVWYLLKNKLKQNINKKYLLVLVCIVIFVISLIFLKIEARGNRLLVLLPFLVIILGICMKKLHNLLNGFFKKVYIFIMIAFFIFQLLETLSWINIKIKPDLREVSSYWIENNIPTGSRIGLENIPIYQFLPDLILQDYYISKRNIYKSKYTYEIITNNYSILPEYIVITNKEVAGDFMVKSSKKDLILILEKNNYQEVYNQKNDFGFFVFFRSKLDYFMSGLVQEPLSISIYKKQVTILSKIN